MDFSTLFSSVIQSVVVETAYGPKVVIDMSAPSSGFLEALRPQASIYLKGDPNPIVLAPYGAPGSTKWPALATALGVSAAVGIVLMVKGLLAK